MIIPPAQRRRRGDLLAPLVEVGPVLAQATWPEPVDQHSGAVPRPALVVDAADPYTGLSLHPRAPPVRSHRRPRADGGGVATPTRRPLRRGRVHLVPTCMRRRQCGTDCDRPTSPRPRCRCPAGTRPSPATMVACLKIGAALRGARRVRPPSVRPPSVTAQ